jgi:F0F1-type ATP synthase beta subunit
MISEKEKALAGIKVIDVLVPLERGGEAVLFGTLLSHLC